MTTREYEAAREIVETLDRLKRGKSFLTNKHTTVEFKCPVPVEKTFSFELEDIPDFRFELIHLLNRRIIELKGIFEKL